MRDYNPWPDIEKIQARVLAIIFDDDQESPPELGILESAMKRIKRGWGMKWISQKDPM